MKAFFILDQPGPARLMNVNSHEVTLKKGSSLGYCYSAPFVEVRKRQIQLFQNCIWKCRRR